MKLSLMIISMLLGFNVWADSKGAEQFSGSWSGTGVYQLQGVQTFCRTFELKFDGNNDLMNFMGGKRECDSHNEAFVQVAMAVQAGKLFYNGQQVGTITDNVLETSFSMPEGNGHVRHWRMSMRKEGNTLVYEESRRMDGEENPLISFAGILIKQ
jgi:hypothetical protein